MKGLRLILIIIISLFCISNIALAQNERDIIKAEENEDIEEFKSDRLAIVIGINNYLNTQIPDLRYSEADAKLIKSILGDKGVFNVLYYSSEQDARPATKDNILNGLKDANQLAKNGLIKTFVFYFAGHGYRHDDENYLASMEFNTKEIEFTGIALNKVLNIIDDIQKNAKTMVFLDACRNEVEGSRRGGSESWVEEETPGSGLGVIFSTSEGQYSYELEEEGHGIFTIFLARGLLGEADMTQYGGNENGFVSFYEIASYVSKKLPEWSISNSEQLSQTPRVTALEINGDFILTKADGDINIDDIDIDTTDDNLNNINDNHTNNNSNLTNNNNNDTDDSKDTPEIPDRKWSFNFNISGGLGFSPSIKMAYDFTKFFSMGMMIDMILINKDTIDSPEDYYYFDGVELLNSYVILNLGILFRLDISSIFPVNYYIHDLYLLLGMGIDVLNEEVCIKLAANYYYNFYSGFIFGGGINFISTIDRKPGILLTGFEITFGIRF